MTQTKPSAWLQKLDEECPYQACFPRRADGESAAKISGKVVIRITIEHPGAAREVVRRPAAMPGDG